MRENLERLKQQTSRQDASLNWEGFLALYLAIVYPLQITPEQAFRAFHKHKWTQELLPPVNQITDRMVKEAARTMTKTEKSIEILEQRYGVNRYELYVKVSKYRSLQKK